MFDVSQPSLNSVKEDYQMHTMRQPALNDKSFHVFVKSLFPGVVLSLFLLAGCANYGSPKNVDIADPVKVESYSLHEWNLEHIDEEVVIILTFSGGGTRAAALSYGVLQELRDTNIVSKGENKRLLDEVDYISSVSGGSFTSAYYGLHGDGIFENFEDDFLRFNLEKHLLYRTINPFLLFSKSGRTESAIKYYQKFLFHDATFADMIKPGRPMIMINTSDLSYGIRFSFIQEYFDLLCSDLSKYPVADAVAASSAVPVLFNPIVIENHDTCGGMPLTGVNVLLKADKYYNGENIPHLISQLATYGDKEKRKFIHFVDGGITDNLGLRAVSDIMAATGGISGYLERARERDEVPPQRLVVIMVNAATESDPDMNLTNKEPSAGRVVGAVTNLQLKRYDDDSILLTKENLKSWEQAFSAPERPAKTHFISVSIQDVESKDVLDFLNSIPTSFALKDEQVDSLIESGRTLLRNNPEFQELLRELNSQ